MSTAAVSAVIDERASDNVCLTLEKSRSTEILTPGIARIPLLHMTDDPCRKDRQSIPERAFAVSDPTSKYILRIIFLASTTPNHMFNNPPDSTWRAPATRIFIMPVRIHCSRPVRFGVELFHCACEDVDLFAPLPNDRVHFPFLFLLILIFNARADPSTHPVAHDVHLQLTARSIRGRVIQWLEAKFFRSTFPTIFALHWYKFNPNANPATHPIAHGVQLQFVSQRRPLFTDSPFDSGSGVGRPVRFGGGRYGCWYKYTASARTPFDSGSGDTQCSNPPQNLSTQSSTHPVARAVHLQLASKRKLYLRSQAVRSGGWVIPRQGELF
ncbi:hypothetical protein B0H12DRAFT_1225639 [Mycena haematopus]|nr:hypothetical protein B0H12DRAFT_1225639 [Mycena haematopus]